MKFTDEQVTELKDLCMKEVPNAEIAAHFGVDVREIHAMRSHHNITIPKVKAMLGKPAVTVKPEFEAAIQEAEKELSVHRHGLNSKIRERFRALQDDILLAMARNGTSDARVRIYNCLGQTVAAIEDAYDGLLRDEE